LIFGGGNISGGISFNSDVDMNGNDLTSVGFINPEGSSTNFGGDLNIGGDRITAADNIEFSRGIEIGDEDTFTGSESVTPASNFTVDSGAEWTNNRNIDSGLEVIGSNLRLNVTSETINQQWNSSVSDLFGLSSSITSDGSNVYVTRASGPSDLELVKFDSSGQEVWREPVDNGFYDAEYHSGSIYGIMKNIGKVGVMKIDDEGGSASTAWSRETAPEFEYEKSPNGITVVDGLLYAVTGANRMIKWDSSGDQIFNKSLSGEGNSIESVDGNIYVSFGDGISRYDKDGNLTWSESFSSTGTILDVEGNDIYTSDSGEVKKYTDTGTGATEEWILNTAGSVEDASIRDGGVYVSSDNGIIEKYIDKGSTASSSPSWSKDLYGNSDPVRGILVTDDNVWVGTDANQEDLLLYEEVTEYSQQGNYTSTTFDAGSVQPFPEFTASSVLPSSTNANVTVRLSNSSDMTGSVSTKLEVGGGLNSEVLDTEARYTEFTVDMSGDGSSTPELDQVSIKYGNSASAYGYNQIALGQSATTNAEGAVAIGYNASSNEKYKAQFGNNNGQELDVDVTGNLSVHGSGGLNVSDDDERIANFDEELTSLYQPTILLNESTNEANHIYTDSEGRLQIGGQNYPGADFSPGTDYLTIDDDTGNIGIGDRSPEERLVLNSNEQTGDADVLQDLRYYDTGEAGFNFYKDQTRTWRIETGDAYGGSLAFQDERNGNILLDLETDGYVGVGTSNPDTQLDVNGDTTLRGKLAVGGNEVSGLSTGDINASEIFYDTITAKSPVVQCSQGSDWCKVSVPENQSSFFVKKSEDFDKDRPRETALEVVESDMETVERFQKLEEENKRQEEKIEELNQTVQGLKSVVCEDNSEAEVCS
jgi:hypothetical protein